MVFVFLFVCSECDLSRAAEEAETKPAAERLRRGLLGASHLALPHVGVSSLGRWFGEGPSR